MARLFPLLSFFLVVAVCSSTAHAWPTWPTTTTTPSPTEVAPEDDSIVYHDGPDTVDGQQHVTLILNNDSDDLENAASLGVYRVIMDVVTKKAVSQLRDQESSEDSQISSNDIETNDLETENVDPPTSATTTATPPPPTTHRPRPRPHPHPHPHPRRCRTCECWDRCRHTRKYNWGICLCGKCHCYR